MSVFGCRPLYWSEGRTLLPDWQRQQEIPIAANDHVSGNQEFNSIGLKIQFKKPIFVTSTNPKIVALADNNKNHR